MGKAYRFALRHADWFKWLVAAGWAAFLAASLVRPGRGLTDFLGFVIASIVAVVIVGVWARYQRERMIREAPLPQYLKRKLRAAYPALAQKDTDLVERGLRQFFLACSRSRGKFVAMPSRVVDAMWHEFILHTQAYRDWCGLALGRFLHHTPAEVLGPQAATNDGLRRAWFWSCKDEAINPRAPTRLPLLFALDTKLAIPDGFHYAPDCGDIARKGAAAAATGVAVHCATDFGDASAASGDADGFGGAEASSSSDGAGGGDGGSSCGGGCGGGD
jgi:hypothetical protein